MSVVDHAGMSWPGKRPYVGGALLVVGGVLVRYVPIQFTLELITMGSPLAAIGLVSAILITLTGVFALLRPDLAPIVGVAGIVLSFLSIMGALGGLLIGVVVTQLGGGLCIVWWVLREIQG